jgi:hypothetical protein
MLAVCAYVRRARDRLPGDLQLGQYPIRDHFMTVIDAIGLVVARICLNSHGEEKWSIWGARAKVENTRAHLQYVAE